VRVNDIRIIKCLLNKFVQVFLREILHFTDYLGEYYRDPSNYINQHHRAAIQSNIVG